MDALQLTGVRKPCLCTAKGARKVLDDRNRRPLVVIGRSALGRRATHRVGREIVAVAAVKAFYRRRKDGAVEREAGEHAGGVANSPHVLLEMRRAVCRWQRMF